MVEGVVKVAEAAGVTGVPASDEEEKQDEKCKGKSPAASRRYCYCPVEGCTSRPLRKLSNHLAQVHKMAPKERSKYLGLKRKLASPQEVAMRKRATLNPRRSQRTLTSFFQAPGPEPDTEELEVVEEEEEDTTSSVVPTTSTTELVDDEPTASLEADPCNRPTVDAPEATGRTQGAGSHSLDEECRVDYASNGQRPGAVARMTMEEFQKARQQLTTPVMTIHVHEHKGVNPAQLVTGGNRPS